MNIALDEMVQPLYNDLRKDEITGYVRKENSFGQRKAGYPVVFLNRRETKSLLCNFIETSISSVHKMADETGKGDSLRQFVEEACKAQVLLVSY